MTEARTAAQERVLIVEDEHNTRRAMARLLSHLGYQPQAFGSAEEALESVYDGESACFALIDLDLPGMSGLDFIKQLSALQPNVYPILITGSDEEALYSRLRDQPVTYLRKPLNFDALVGLLSQQAGRG
jgi:DNA-binding NtrC family response regulator